MYASKDAALFFPSSPESNSAILADAVAASTGFKGLSAFGILSKDGISTFPPSLSAHAFAALDPLLYERCGKIIH